MILLVAIISAYCQQPEELSISQQSAKTDLHHHGRHFGGHESFENVGFGGHGGGHYFGKITSDEESELIRSLIEPTEQMNEEQAKKVSEDKVGSDEQSNHVIDTRSAEAESHHHEGYNRGHFEGHGGFGQVQSDTEPQHYGGVFGGQGGFGLGVFGHGEFGQHFADAEPKRYGGHFGGHGGYGRHGHGHYFVKRSADEEPELDKSKEQIIEEHPMEVSDDKAETGEESKHVIATRSAEAGPHYHGGSNGGHGGFGHGVFGHRVFGHHGFGHAHGGQYFVRRYGSSLPQQYGGQLYGHNGIGCEHCRFGQGQGEIDHNGIFVNALYP